MSKNKERNDKDGKEGKAERKARLVRREFTAKGTTCESCEKIIKKQALRIPGVKEVEFDYSTEKGHVTFDENMAGMDEIMSSIGEKGYECSLLDKGIKNANGAKDVKDVNDALRVPLPRKSTAAKTIGWLIAITGLLVIGYFIFGLVDKISLPELSPGIGYGLLFAIGLLTGFHCVAMCGGFVLSYTAKAASEGKKAHLSHAAYGIGKTISYTVMGALFGLLGSFIVFTPAIRAAAGIIAGLFLILFGLKMLNIIPFLRKIQFRTPRFIARFVGEKQASNASPLVIGLLNGLMLACGPLQAIYVMAASTGSMLEGAKLLFIFGLGTLPVMLGFGYIASFLSGKATRTILKVSGALVIILGLIMLNRGLALSGTGYDFKSIVARSQFNSLQGNSGNSISGGGDAGGDAGGASGGAGNIAVLKDGYQEIHMDVLSSGWSPDTFILKKGVPVHWIINGKQITSCNRAIQVPKYGLSFNIKPGEQTITFTPTESGVISWSCWMGMIQGTFVVKDDISNSAEVQKDLQLVASKPKSSGGGCGCGG